MYLRKSFASLIIIIPLAVLLAACDADRVYEQNVKIPDYRWSWDNKVSFETEITDLSSHYNLYLNIRHAWQYPYSNLWVLIHTYFPDGGHLEKRIQIEIADKEGKPYADCSGDICDLCVPIQTNAYFEQPGLYRWEVEQNMRTEELPMMIAVGFRIEKADSGK